MPARGARPPEFGIRPESGARGIYRRQLLGKQVTGSRQHTGVRDEHGGERAQRGRGGLTVGGLRHQAPPGDALLVVGAGAALVGAGAGGLAGGLSRGVAGAADGWAAGADGCAPGADGCVGGADGWALDRPAAGRVATGELVARDGLPTCCAAPGAGVRAAGTGLVDVAGWTFAIFAGALLANTNAKPTAASAPSCVVRRVSLLR